MDSQLATMDETSNHVLNSVDSVNSQELAMDIDFDSIKSEIVSYPRSVDAITLPIRCTDTSFLYL
jgi:hypothetical protein